MKKGFIVFTTMTTVINSTMGSSLPSNAIPYFTAEWHVTSETEKVLPISVFLIGESFPPHASSRGLISLKTCM